MTKEGRFKVTDADRKYKTEAWKRFQQGNPAYIYIKKAQYQNDPKTSANA